MHTVAASLRCGGRLLRVLRRKCGAQDCLTLFTLYHTCCTAQVRAGMTVAEGSELFASYVNPEAPRRVRRAHLLQRYGFECCCNKCEAEAAVEQQ